MKREDESKIEWSTPEREAVGIRTPLVVAVGFGTLVVFAFAVVATWAVLQYRERHLNPYGASVPAVLGQPDINIVNQTPFVRDTRAYQLLESKRARLGTYGWVDRERGLVHIPIERAMERVVERRGAPREEAPR
ncbi:MAG TPA: hypothetical protein VLQ93_15230 [Myxococcaceae bacterium]|nr:hypothetical protein [Myxococcaceae bacterium]